VVGVNDGIALPRRKSHLVAGKAATPAKVSEIASATQ
jgi:hypothetical protein